MTKDQAKNFVNYVATRESVSINFNSLDLTEEELNRKATMRQKDTIDGLLLEVPSAKETFEYEDFKRNPTIGNASELISRAAEMRFGPVATDKVIGHDEAKNFVEYVAKRPGAVREGAHGLFSSVPNLNLDKIAEEVANYQGRIWRNVISIRREDADTLGYNTQKPWKEAVQQQIDTIAENFHIPPEHLRWYAGMHNTGHHPHIHLFVYSTNPKEGHLNEVGIKNIKRGFSEIIFANERLHIYQQKDEAREKLKSQVDELLSHLDLSGSQFPDHQTEKIYQNLLQLGSAVQNQPGRHFYKYLSKELKQQTDRLLTELASAPDIKALYALYCEQQQNLKQMYVNEPAEMPITENKELYFLKNKVIQYAEKLAGAVIGIAPANESSQASGSDPSEKNQYDITAENERFETSSPSSDLTDEENLNSLWNNIPPEPESNEPDEEYEGVYQEAFPEERDSSHHDDISSKSVFELQEKAIGLNGNASSRYELAKRYFYGQGVDRDCEKARMWFGLAAESGHTLAKYQLGKMYLYGIGIEKDLNLGKEYCLDAFYDITNELQQKTGAAFRDDLCYPGMETDNSYYAYLEYLVGRIELAGEGVKQADQNAFLWFRASALHGHVHSEYMLAKMYYDGRGTVQDYEEALRLYREAADQKDKYACYATGRMLLRGIGAPEDTSAAASYFMKASKQNVPYADFALARLCETGTGVSKDEAAAHTLYKKALDEFIEQEQQQPDGFTEYRIAEMYLLGKGTQVDTAKAEEWFQKAVDFGSPQAAYELAGLYAAGSGIEIDTDKAYDLYQIARKGFLSSEQENPNAGQEYKIAGMYEKGLGTEATIQEALKWYATAADNGHGHAAYRLGKTYLSGTEVEQDYDAAFKWLTRSADLQDKYAYYALGRMYYDGTGVTKDLHQAAHWFLLASEQNIPYADYLLAGMYEFGTGISANAEKSAILYSKALTEFLEQENQQPDSMIEYRIASMYLHGKGMEQNPEKVADWFAKAVESGSPQAAYELAKLYESGNGVPCDTEKAQNLYQTALKGFLLSEQDNPNTEQEYKIAEMYLYGKGAEQDSDVATIWFEKAASSGSPYAAYQLAQLYQSENGASKDDPLPAKLYYKSLLAFLALEKKGSDASREYRIGKIFEYGLGTQIDPDKAAAWYKLAADHGHGYAQYQYSSLCKETNPLAANRYFYMALQTFLKEERESASTQQEYKIAKMLLQLRDSSTAPQSLEYEQAATQWLEKAADGGNAYAAFEAARLLEEKPYSSSDPETICFYYQLALTGFFDLFSDKTTDSETKARLAAKIARMYLNGNGTAIQEDDAFRWFSKAAELGDLSAQYQIGKMLLNGTGCDMDGNEAFRVFLNVAKRGNTFAQYQVGKMFENGIGTAKDPNQSEYWFRTAAANGNEAAQNHLNYLEHQKEYGAQTVVGSFLRMLGSGINDRIEDSTTRRYGIDRKTRMKRRQQKAALGQKEEELDEVM